MEMIKTLGAEFKQNYLRLIAAGYIESAALSMLETDWIDFFELCSKDPNFRDDIDTARKARADRWVDRIALSVDKEYSIVLPDGNRLIRPPNKDENSRDKLEFEKLKFLAQADNPDKYGQSAGKTKIDLSLDLSEFKLLSPQESIKALNNDPFNKMATVDAEIVVKKTEPNH